MRKLLLFTTVILLSSCNTITKIAYGIKDPQIENEKSIIEYAEKVNLKTNNIYTYDFNSFIKNIKGKSIPDVFIFNKNKDYIPYGDVYACNASSFDFIEKLNKNGNYSPSDKISWTQITNGLTDLKGNETQGLMGNKSDFYVFIVWTKYTGKLNKNHVKIWEQQAINNKTANLQVIKINMDFQEFWGEENLNKFNVD